MVARLPITVQKLIEQRVRSGRYRNAQDVVVAALASLDEHEQLSQLASADLKRLFPGMKQKIVQGLRQAEAGKLSNGEAFFRELEWEDSISRRNRKTA
jgi:Arc/MetJ-type ribon-helix-helix transcriptional regulator